MQQVLSKSVDIGLCGPEQVIYINNQGKEDYPIIFGQLTQTDGSFLVGRKVESDFKWESLKGKTVIGGRPGGVPEMVFEYILRNHGVVPGKDINIITNLAFTATAGAFKSGTGEYVTLFEPTATALEEDKSGYIVASLGEAVGTVPYTCFFSTKSYMEKNNDLIQKFMNAIYEGQKYVEKNNEKDISTVIKKYFEGQSEESLAKVIKNYKNINAYAYNPILKESEMSKLMDIIQSYNNTLIPQRPKFDKIVNNSFSEKLK